LYTVKIKTLTPLWTGDAYRKGETLRETGIIGSLRWWYEALIRGLGGTACDPTDTQCNDKSRCDACELFGCTGWSRKFRLEVNTEREITNLSFFIGSRKYIGAKRPVSGVVTKAPAVLTFTPLKEISSGEWQLLRESLQIIADKGALGGRTSQGNGAIKVIENNLPVKNSKISLKGTRANNINCINRPNLADFFFWKYKINFAKDIADLIKEKLFWTHASEHFNIPDNWDQWKKVWKDYGILPIAFHVRDTLRRSIENGEKRHELLGQRGKGSQIFVSHGYKKENNGSKSIEFRVFGYGTADDLIKKLEEDMNNRLSEKLFSSSTKKDSNENITQIEFKATTGKQIIEKLKDRLEVLR